MTSEIQEYNEVTAGLESLKSRMKDVVYGVTTTKGMAEAKGDRLQIVRLRTSLESKRKEIKAPALEHCKKIDAEAKRITEELLALEVPIDEQIKAEENRKEAEKKARIEAERSRVAGIMAAIEAIRSTPANSRTMKSCDISEQITTIEAIGITADDFAEFQGLAETTRDAVISELNAMQLTAARREEEAARLEAARIEEEQKREAERAERDRLAVIEAERLRAEAEKLAAEREEFRRQLARAEEQEAEAAMARAEADAKAKAQRDEEDRARAAAMAAQQAEIDRQRVGIEQKQEELAAQEAKEARDKAELEAWNKREVASKEHRSTVEREATRDLVNLGLDADTAAQIVQAIARDEVDHLSINY